MLRDVMDDLASQIQEALEAVESQLNGDDDTPMPVDPMPEPDVTADMTLASKGMTVQESSSSSNAAYYCAGATLVGAAAVAFCLLNKKENKEN